MASLSKRKLAVPIAANSVHNPHCGEKMRLICLFLDLLIRPQRNATLFPTHFHKSCGNGWGTMFYFIGTGLTEQDGLRAS
jgi:hypothetical protein